MRFGIRFSKGQIAMKYSFLNITKFGLMFDNSLQYWGITPLVEFRLPFAIFTFCLFGLFAAFYNGQRLHSHLTELSDEIYQLEWHQYSNHMRRHLILMMVRAQRPFYLSAYGIMPFTLENFVQVRIEYKAINEVIKLHLRFAGSERRLFSADAVAKSGLKFNKIRGERLQPSASRSIDIF